MCSGPLWHEARSRTVGGRVSHDVMFQNRIQIHTTDDEQRRRSRECTERRIGDVKREKAHRQSIETEWEVRVEVKGGLSPREA